MMFRAIVPLLCGGLLLLSGALEAGASEFNGPITLAQATVAPTMVKYTCAYNKDRKACGGTCPVKQRCQKMAATNCGCK
jgi:hypothetical protein